VVSVELVGILCVCCVAVSRVGVELVGTLCVCVVLSGC
jgi:hypothetical protein